MQVNFEDIQAVANQIKTMEAERDALAGLVVELRGALEEVDEYEGGADSALQDEYVTERRHTALALPLPAAAAKVATLRARIAELEGERDAAKAEAERWQGQAADIAQHPVVVRLLLEKGDLQSQLLHSAQQLEAARAGEARAVEALKGVAEKARWILLDQCVKRGHDPRSAIGDWSLNVGDYLRDEIEGMALVESEAAALRAGKVQDDE